MIYFTSDWHFNHAREFIYKARGCNSIQEMNNKIVSNCNSVLTPNDDLYVLGDLCLGGEQSIESNKELISSINGKIHIVYGNHCTPSRRAMYSTLDNVVESASAIELTVNKIHFYLSHYPTITTNLQEESLKQAVVNLCGHRHTTDPFYDCDKGIIYHCEVDAHNLYPVSIDKIIQELKLKFFGQ